jgi:hypothetical protein
MDALAEAYFGIFQSLAVTFDWMSFMVEKRVPLRPIFKVRNSQKSLRARPGECGAWAMIGMFVLVRDSCTTSNM